MSPFDKKPHASESIEARSESFSVVACSKCAYPQKPGVNRPLAHAGWTRVSCQVRRLFFPIRWWNGRILRYKSLSLDFLSLTLNAFRTIFLGRVLKDRLIRRVLRVDWLFISWLAIKTGVALLKEQSLAKARFPLTAKAQHTLLGTLTVEQHHMSR